MRASTPMGDAASITILPAGNASEWTGPTGTNTYLLAGAVPALVDAGTGDPAHMAEVARALGGRELALVLITHDHPDHAGGIDAVRARWPAARVRSARADMCRDGEVVRAGDVWLRAVHTPGHAPDHFCFFDEASRDVFCGDLARLGGTIVIPASGGGDLSAYLASLRRLDALRPRRLLPGHGPVVDDPAALIAGYLAHRERRERQIAGVLRDGVKTPEEIVARVYGPLTPSLEKAAAESVLAHLRKMSVEGRAVQNGSEWRLT